MRYAVRVSGLALTVLAVLGVGAMSSSAATGSTAGTSAAGCNHFFYISGDAVRARKSPGGPILGLTWKYQRIQHRGLREGRWQQVTFLFPLASGVRTAWVASQFVGYWDRTTSVCPT